MNWNYQQRSRFAWNNMSDKTTAWNFVTKTFAIYTRPAREKGLVVNVMCTNTNTHCNHIVILVDVAVVQNKSEANEARNSSVALVNFCTEKQCRQRRMRKNHTKWQVIQIRWFFLWWIWSLGSDSWAWQLQNEYHSWWDPVFFLLPVLLCFSHSKVKTTKCENERVHFSFLQFLVCL